jgi:prophage regulatory protein
MRLLSYRDLLSRGIPYSKVQLWRLERDGKFPQRVRLSYKHHGWPEAEIDSFIRDRMSQRQGYGRATKSV